MFGKKEVKLSNSQIEKLNGLLVDRFKKDVWTTKDFDNYSIYHKVEALKTDVKKLLESAESELPRFAEYTKTFEDSIIEIKANNYFQHRAIRSKAYWNGGYWESEKVWYCLDWE